MDAAPVRVRFDAKKWLCFALCAALGAAHAFGSSVFSAYFAGLGRSVQLLGFFLLGVWLCPKPLQINKASVFLSVCAVLLSLVFFLFSSNMVRFFSLPAALFCIFLALFSLSGQLSHASLSAQGVYESVCRSFCVPFRHLHVPAQAASALCGEKKRVRGLGVSVAICIPLVLTVIMLLASADDVFEGVFAQAFSLLARLQPGATLWNIIKTVSYTLLMFSALYALCQPKWPIKPVARPQNLPALPFVMPAALLNVVYVLFVYIQLRYLFGNAETAAMSGGYAQYARNGFFQLVLVTVINLLCILPALTLRGDLTALRWLCGLLTINTFIILFSALYRMRLYISVYGLTHLRLLTLWGIAMIAGALLLCLYKAVRPQRAVCPALLCLLLVGWLTFVYMNGDYMIASYNIAHLPPEVLDYDHLGRLSPDALPALRELDQQTLENLRDMIFSDIAGPVWYDAGLSWLIF